MKGSKCGGEQLPARRLVSPGLLSACAAMAAVAPACIGVVPTVPYRIGTVALSSLGLEVSDSTLPFATTFCATLTHLDPSNSTWGACSRYLETSIQHQPAATKEIPTDLGVLVVGGLFSDCFENRSVSLLSDARAHLTGTHGIATDVVPVSGVATPEVNAAKIDTYLKGHPGNYIAVGHSKGAVDLMFALQTYDSARAQIKAFVSVAGAIYGSRLVDLGKPLVIAGFQQAFRDTGLGECAIADEGAVDSLRRDRRYAFNRAWSPPSGLPMFSIVGVVDKCETSGALQEARHRLELYSQDQDSQVIAEEAIVPRAQFLAVARGDHWALAVPLAQPSDVHVHKGIEQNIYPRAALLEAIVRYVHGL
jgi:hypothetical protein